MELRNIIESLSKTSERVFDAAQEFRRGDETLPPIYHVVTRENDLVMIEPPHPDKHVAAEMMREWFAESKPQLYVFIAEAWVTTITPTATSRREVVSYFGEDSNGRTMSASRDIVRTGDRASLGPLQFHNDITLGGAMTGLLPPSTATRH